MSAWYWYSAGSGCRAAGCWCCSAAADCSCCRRSGWAVAPGRCSGPGPGSLRPAWPGPVAPSHSCCAAVDRCAPRPAWTVPRRHPRAHDTSRPAAGSAVRCGSCRVSVQARPSSGMSVQPRSSGWRERHGWSAGCCRRCLATSRRAERQRWKAPSARRDCGPSSWLSPRYEHSHR